MATTTELLHARKRQAAGTKSCRRLRAKGEVPAILYGHRQETVPIQVSHEELQEALRRRARMFELELENRKEFVLLKEVQYDAFGDDIIHADFIRVAMDEKLTLEVPIILKGSPKVEHAVLQQTLGHVEIECLPKDIPESIVAMVGDLKLDETVKVSQLVVPPGVKILTDPEVIVATLSAAEEEAAAPAAPAAEAEVAEPEVIGRQAKTEEAEEETEESEEDKKKK